MTKDNEKKKQKELKNGHLRFDRVLHLSLKDRVVILSNGDGTIAPLVLSPPIFRKLLFDYRRWLESHSDPYDRVAYFECIVDGVWNRDKYINLILLRCRNDKEREDIF